jgi:hypothetical protein
MFAEPTAADSLPRSNSFTAADVLAILSQHGWLPAQCAELFHDWLAQAAALLGPHAADRPSLESLLELIFHYDAAEILAFSESRDVLSRVHARDVLRELARKVLESRPLDSDRFKEIISALKSNLDFRGRILFYPIRLALAGRAGEGVMDRVILLLDSAAALPFAVPVKGARQRMLEFCAALD